MAFLNSVKSQSSNTVLQLDKSILSLNQTPLFNVKYETDIAPCKTFHQKYDVYLFCSKDGLSTSELCKSNFKYSHNFSLSPNQSCSIDSSLWGSFAFHSSCTTSELSATYSYGLPNGKSCVTSGSGLPVDSDVNSLNYCALQVIVQTYAGTTLPKRDCYLYYEGASCMPNCMDFKVFTMNK